MNDGIRGLLASKKFLAVLVAGITAILLKVAARHHVAIEPDDAQELVRDIVGLAISYAIGQGIADHGKERAAIEAEAKAPAEGTPR